MSRCVLSTRTSWRIGRRHKSGGDRSDGVQSPTSGTGRRPRARTPTPVGNEVESTRRTSDEADEDALPAHGTTYRGCARNRSSNLGGRARRRSGRRPERASDNARSEPARLRSGTHRHRSGPPLRRRSETRTRVLRRWLALACNRAHEGALRRRLQAARFTHAVGRRAGSRRPDLGEPAAARDRSREAGRVHPRDRRSQRPAARAAWRAAAAPRRPSRATPEPRPKQLADDRRRAYRRRRPFRAALSGTGDWRADRSDQLRGRLRQRRRQRRRAQARSLPAGGGVVVRGRRQHRMRLPRRRRDRQQAAAVRHQGDARLSRADRHRGRRRPRSLRARTRLRPRSEHGLRARLRRRGHGLVAGGARAVWRAS